MLPAGVVASAIPTWGFTANLIALLPSVFYYATPENEWAQLLHPHVTEWLVPQDPEAIRYFFEGLPAGQPIPWSAWMTPLLAWVSFILSIYLMMITTMIIMRRHWVEHDRLTFPLLQLPMDMAEEGEPGSKLTPFVKQPLMWARHHWVWWPTHYLGFPIGATLMMNWTWSHGPSG